MKKIQNYFKEVFSFTQNEAKGALTLLFILVLFVVAMHLSDMYLLGSPPEITIEQLHSLDSTAHIVQRNTQNLYKNDTERKQKRFPFDPNKASVSTLISLGLPPYLAERIDKYRSKGGKFKHAEDLQKIYGFPPSLWAELAPYMQFPLSSTHSNPSFYTSPTSSFKTQNEGSHTTSTPAKNEYANAKSKTIRFDINTADTTQLKSLPGIGIGYARRIIAFRDKLGGFTHVEQIAETYQLSEMAIQSVLEQCFVQKEIQKIAINKIDKIIHPYLSYSQANSVINYRKQHGPYNNENDLRAVKTLDEQTLRRILPYLSFD